MEEGFISWLGGGKETIRLETERDSVSSYEIDFKTFNQINLIDSRVCKLRRVPCGWLNH
jgi:hypothetical protein